MGMRDDECQIAAFFPASNSSILNHLIPFSMPRVTRIAGSFAIVVIVYWAYALLVVRWIEPPVDLRSDGDITDERSGAGVEIRRRAAGAA